MAYDPKLGYDPTDPSTYSGVPDGTQRGLAVRTGTARTSNSSDYTTPVYMFDGTSWRLVPNGTSIPAGATVSLGSPPVGTTMTPYEQTLTGNQAQQTANQAAADANRHTEAMTQYANSAASAQAQYNLDVQKFGLDQAKFNYQQSMDAADQKLKQATFGLQTAQFGLSQDQFNASQRQALAAAKLEVDKLLASKSGPGDWVQYNRLLNGMSKPTPTGTTVIDPYASLKDLYQPSNIARPAAPDLNVPTNAYTATVAPYPTAAVTASPPPPAPIAPVSPAVVRKADPFNIAPPDVAGSGNTSTRHAVDQSGNLWEDDGTPGGTWHDRTGHFSTDGGKTWATDPMGTASANYVPPSDPSIYGTRTTNPPAAIPVPSSGLPHEARGGITRGAAIVGDSRSGRPTGHEELAYARTDPLTGQSLLDVIPHNAIAAILDKHTGGKNGTTIGAHKLPPNLLQGLPRAALGGEFGGNDGPQGAPDQWHGGDNLLQPRVGDVGDQRGHFSTAPGWLVTDPKGAGGPLQPSQAPGIMRNSAGTGRTPSSYSPPTGSASAPAQPATTGGSAASQNQGTGLSSTNIAASQSGVTSPAPSGNLLNGSPTATNPATSTGYVPDAPGSYGTANTQPYNVLNTYSRQTLAAQPFWQKILGNQPGREFGNFGASLDNPSLGIQNAPFNISMQRYNLLAPSEQAQLKSLYEQGLSIPFDDVLAAAKAAAPVGRNRSSYGQMVQPNSYGR